MSNTLLHLVVRSNNELLYEFFQSQHNKELTSSEVSTCLSLLKENNEAWKRLQEPQFSQQESTLSSTLNHIQSTKLDYSPQVNPNIPHKSFFVSPINPKGNIPNIFRDQNDTFIKAHSQLLLSDELQPQVTSKTFIFQAGNENGAASYRLKNSVFKSCLKRMEKGRISRPMPLVADTAQVPERKKPRTEETDSKGIKMAPDGRRVTKAARLILEALDGEDASHGHRTKLAFPRLPSFLEKKGSQPKGVAVKEAASMDVISNSLMSDAAGSSDMPDKKAEMSIEPPQEAVLSVSPKESPMESTFIPTFHFDDSSDPVENFNWASSELPQFQFIDEE